MSEHDRFWVKDSYLKKEMDDSGYYSVVVRLEDYNALRQEIARLTAERDEALGYLGRLFAVLAPQCACLGTLLGVCTQIDNAIAGLKADLAQAEQERERMREAATRAFDWLKRYRGCDCTSHYTCPFCILEQALTIKEAS